MNFEEQNIRDIINKEVNTLLAAFLNRVPENDLKRQYVGKVVNNNDPDKIGRCQIRVFGIFENDIQDNDLPWAMPEFTFIGSKKGSFIVPPVDAIVRVFFDNGDIYLPIYSTKVLDQTNLPADINTDYPNTMVFYETDNGDKFTINRSNGDTKFIHRSGTQITIDATGNLLIDGTQQVTINHANLLTVAGSTVIPDLTYKGPLCAIPVCPLTGLSHVGNVCAP